ncbi:MAG: DUF4197 domain-containing protein [Candidatus Cloacimonadota bacterium]|nr:MAG: DUF4197 domain-containing protein [Candidatus Cloacimonadota bacterium]
MKKLIVVLSFLIFFTSCEKTGDIADIISDIPLTETEVIEGLKEALTVGTDTAVSTVSQVNGYFLDELIKIYLPPEANIIVENVDNPILAAIGVDAFIEDMVLKLNRAAEDAAKEAAPIFIDAITEMTIQDAFGILNGADTSATHYLREKTFIALQEAFQPKIATSLHKPIVAGISAAETWTSFTTLYNDIANSLAGQLAGLTAVDTELDAYVTTKGLHGLFVKVADEEQAIRTDPLARVTDILERVFGGN